MHELGEKPKRNYKYFFFLKDSLKSIQYLLWLLILSNYLLLKLIITT